MAVKVPVACCFDFCKTNTSGVSVTKFLFLLTVIAMQLLKYH